MKALCWNGINDLAVETVDDPKLVNPHDVIVDVGLSTTCGSDLHLIGGYIPGMREGDVLGHEFMGTVVETGSEITDVRVGQRVVVPSFIGCNQCWYCDRQLYSLCDTTNPNAHMQQAVLGYPGAGVYGYTHPFGGYQGSHAEFIRVPFGDANCFPIPDGVGDEQALFLSDAAPTGYTAATMAEPAGKTIAVWGAGAVGMMAAASSVLLGAERVIIIDKIAERLMTAGKVCPEAETLDFDSVPSVVEALRELTAGRGPDACIDAVGMEASGGGLQYAYDRVKQFLRLESDRATALRQAIMACRKGGIVSVVGIYGLTDKFPFGIVTNKGLTIRSAQQHGQAFVPDLLKAVQSGKLDPAPMLTHDLPLRDAVRGYDLFKSKKDGCIRAAFRP